MLETRLSHFKVTVYLGAQANMTLATAMVAKTARKENLRFLNSGRPLFHLVQLVKCCPIAL